MKKEEGRERDRQHHQLCIVLLHCTAARDYSHRLEYTAVVKCQGRRYSLPWSPDSPGIELPLSPTAYSRVILVRTSYE